MSQQVLQYKRSVEVIPSDNADIPSPFIITQGTAGEASYTLNDGDADFVSLNINAGDIVYGSGLAATVLEVLDIKSISINADIFGAGGPYTIYRKSESAPVLSVIAGSGIEAITEAGDEIYLTTELFRIIPVRVTRVMATGTGVNGPLYALW